MHIEQLLFMSRTILRSMYGDMACIFQLYGLLKVSVATIYMFEQNVNIESATMNNRWKMYAIRTSKSCQLEEFVWPRFPVNDTSLPIQVKCEVYYCFGTVCLCNTGLGTDVLSELCTQSCHLRIREL